MKTYAINRPALSRALRAGTAVLGMLLAAGVCAQNQLENISYQTGPGGQVDVVMDLAEPTDGEPRIFTTTDPARIAIDFNGTSNGLTQRSIAIGSGATRSVSAVEANDTTRVVIDLFRMSEYETRTEGDKFIVSIGGSGNVTSAIAAAGRSGGMASGTGGGSMDVQNIDFRRGPNGEGRVIVTFTGSNPSVDMREDGGDVVVNLYDVQLPERLQRRLDVMDFATPVQMIEAVNQGDDVRLVIESVGDVEKLAYQAGNEYVIEVGERQIVEEEEERDALEPPTYDGSRVTFNFQDIPVRSVLQLIADVSGLNIVVADSVDGNVTLRLQNVPWDQALDIILNAKSLDKRENGNVVWIAPAEEIAARERQQLQALQEKKVLAPLRSTIIQINYANASELKTLIEDEGSSGRGGGSGTTGAETSRGLLSNRGSVTVHEPTNTLLLTDTSERIDQIRRLISELDRPIRQVQIESRVVIATEDFRKDLGVRFGITSSREDSNGNVISTSGSLGALDAMNNAALNNRFVRGGQGGSLPTINPGPLPLGVAVPTLADRLNVNLPVQSPQASGFGFTVLAADYLLDLELSALESEGRGEIISTPRVIAANQQEAFIKQGTEIAFQSVATSGGTTLPQTEFKEVVLELRVVPLITPDDRIVLDLLVKKDEPRFDLVTGGEPAIDKREVQTNVLVDNGQTVVLGGVYEYSKRDAEAGVPLLSDIPGLGALFRQTLKDREKAELLIFVTPTILDERVGFK